MKIWVRVAAAVLSIAAATAFTAACGNDSDDESTGSTGTGSAGGFQAYLSCLSKNGVEMQMPTGMPTGMPGGGFPSGAAGPAPSGMPGGGMFQKPDGVDDDTWQKAQAACASVQPSLGAGTTQDNGAISAYLNCLSNHGVTTSAQPQSLNTADPTVAAAQKACGALLPSGMPAAG